MSKEVLEHLENINKELVIVNDILIKTLPLESEWHFKIQERVYKFLSETYKRDDFITLSIKTGDDKE